MDMMHSSRSNKRQRIDSTPSLSLSHLPANVLSNCFSFLGPSGHYYFLATVCKDFKVAVDELYGDDRNTSVDSILTSVSTCNHVMTLFFASDLTLTKVLDAVFENDRLDLFIGVIMKAYRIPRLQNYVTAMANAIRDKSTEIMRFIIKNEEIIYLLKNKEPPEGVQIKETTEVIEHNVQAIVAACDPDMVYQLVEKGVEFNAISIIMSLRRKDLETFKCLLDIVHVEEEDQLKSTVVSQALQHEFYLDAIKYLKQKGYLDNEDTLTQAILSTIRTKKAAAINVAKGVLEGRRDISVDCISMIIIICINKECMDILSYIHDSIQRIDIDFWIRYAERKNLEQVVAHLRTMQ